MSWLIWLGIMVALFLVELLTVDLIAIWFALSALVLVIVTAIFPQLYFGWQFCIFIVLSAVLLLSTRKIVKNLMKKRNDQETNLDLVLNHTGMVVTEINNNLEQGEVKINGIVWSARTEDASILSAQTLVTVVQIKGNKLIVKKQEN